MKSITTNPLSADCWWPPGYHSAAHKIVKVDLNHIRDGIVNQVDRQSLRILSLEPTLIKDTPHFQYALGNTKPYEEYLEKCKHITWARAAINEEHLDMQYMFDKFDKILNTDAAYLDPPHQDKYIIINQQGHLIDGLHRSVALLRAGINIVPAALTA
tara:strand:- start:6863 stop:7333 length:471 start_codon:yes stop_codon:yes gene_type:complete